MMHVPTDMIYPCTTRRKTRYAKARVVSVPRPRAALFFSIVKVGSVQARPRSPNKKTRACVALQSEMKRQESRPGKKAEKRVEKSNLQDNAGQQRKRERERCN